MNFDFTETKESFAGAEDRLKKEYLQISTGRANPSLLDGINIDSYGTVQPIKNVASINIEDAKSMKVTPWDRTHIQLIEKAMHDSGLPFSVSVDSSGLRISIPQVTEENKRALVKLLKEKLEDARVQVRNIRQDAMKAIDLGEENGDYAEDSKNRAKDDLQKMVDDSNKKLEDIFNKKEEDLMKV